MTPPFKPAVRPERSASREVLALLAFGFCALVLWPEPARATVEEQRARLPPAADCNDPIEGTWLAHKYDPDFKEWYIYSAKVRRRSPGSSELTGDIESHFWSGGPGDVQPPACKPGMFHWIVQMPAKGTYDGEKIQFGGTSWRADPPLCPPPFEMGYNPDNFTGQIDKKTQEFQSVNNDGGRAVNSPTVFRRVRCLEAPPPAGVSAKPPPFAPPKKIFHCGKP